jgi:hypothetical protein
VPFAVQIALFKKPNLDKSDKTILGASYYFDKEEGVLIFKE